MSSSIQQSWRRARILLGTLTIAIAIATGCTYRYTNEHIVRPEGIETIAVEAIYDTSREVLPHEMLWQALQDAVAANGHLKLAPQDRADALMRAHLRQATILPLGTKTQVGVERDPLPYQGGRPAAPSEHRLLTRSSAIRPHGQISMIVDVEVWSLRTRTLLLRRSYPLSGPFNAVFSDRVTPRENMGLRYDEASSARFRTLSQGLASSVVQDLLVR